MLPECLQRVLVALLVTLNFGACRCEQPPEPGEPTSRPASDVSERWELQLTQGPSLSIQRRGSKLRIVGQDSEWGTLKLSPDRVKLSQTGRETAKAKAKDYGFKVYEGEREVFEVKRRGSGYQLRRADDTVLGMIQGNMGTIGGEPVRIEPGGLGQVLRRGDTPILSVKGHLKPEALLLLGATEASLPQRFVMAYIVNEGIAP